MSSSNIIVRPVEAVEHFEAMQFMKLTQAMTELVEKVKLLNVHEQACEDRTSTI